MSDEFVDLDELERLAGPLLDPRDPPEWFSPGDVMLTDLSPEDEAFVIAASPEVVLALVRAARWLVEAYEAEPPVLSPVTRDKTAEVVAPFRGPPVGA